MNSLLRSVVLSVLVVLASGFRGVTAGPAEYPDMGSTSPLEFNERGFVRSNSVHQNGEEIVSNFNGNLMYKKTLFQTPGVNGLGLDLTLVYNGGMQIGDNFAGAVPRPSHSSPFPLELRRLDCWP